MNKLFMMFLAVMTGSALAFNVHALSCSDLDGATVFSQENSPVYLGFFGSSYASESIMNQYGTYGSEYNALSVRNEYGTYGSPYNTYSATNSYTSSPPVMYKNGNFIGYLTTNTYQTPGASLGLIDNSCNFYSSVPSTGGGGLPAPPVVVDASDGTDSTEIQVDWSPVSGAIAYNIYVSDTLTSSKYYLGQYQKSMWAIPPETDVVYYFWVYSVNANGESTVGTYDTGYASSAASGPADLAITVLDVPDGTYAPGDELVVLNRVENLGSSDSGSYRLKLYASTDASITSGDYYIGYSDREGLGAGENHYFNTTWSNSLESLPAGDYYIGAILDANDAESRNNSRYDTVPITVDSELPSFQMNAGLNDAWYFPNTNGQGFYITVFPEIGYVSLAWFTYDTVRPDGDVTANLGEAGHRWLNAIGQYSGNQAVLNVSFATGGLFDSPAEVTEVSDGTIILTFDDCGSGTVEYDIPSIGQTGTVPIQRVVGDNIALCEAMSEQAATQQLSSIQKTDNANSLLPVDLTNSIESAMLVDMNAGLNDAWYYPVTNGQGFYITVFPEIGYVSLAWFTYDTVRPDGDVTANLGEPGHRWLNAIGQYSGNQATLNVSFASGGLFDSPTEVTEVSDGTIVLTFDDCSSGTVEYDIPSIGRTGVVPIQRVVGDNIALCEAFNAQ